jgi:G6PDH family F420-dependent oxidoreductase
VAELGHFLSSEEHSPQSRFELGVGTGEYLNEHILGGRWPPADVRLDMLAEAIHVMRQLWTGDEITYRGIHYTVENARLYTCPEQPPAVMMSAFGSKAADLAADIADGFVSTKPDAELLGQYRQAGGRGPASASVKVCWGPDAEECARLAHRLWRSSGVPGELSQELRTPPLFDQASELVTVESMAQHTPCGPAVEPIVDAVRTYVNAGFDRIYLNQIGPAQAQFFRFLRQELAGALADIGVRPDATPSRSAA